MGAGPLLHETASRLRLRLPSAGDAAALRVALEMIDGVRAVRVALAARSLTVHYDGRAATRAAILARHGQPAPALADDDLPRRHGETLPLEAPLLAAALTPALPTVARPAVALGLVAAKAVGAWRRQADLTAAALDAVALATTALTGHPLTATTSVLLGALAERRRDTMLQETDRLLAVLAPRSSASYRAERDGQSVTGGAAQLASGDRVRLSAGDLVPADGLVLGGDAEVAEPLTGEAATHRVATGVRLRAGARLLDGALLLRLERTAARSRSARLRDHVRHVLRVRDAPGPLTPDLERLIALPMTAAGLVLALTGDAARTAAMLQADPQLGISLAHPVAREAAIYATARSGALMAGLEPLERLAAATTFAFEDVGVLAEPYWFVDLVRCAAPEVAHADVERWLALLAGHGEPALLAAGLPDEQVSVWREHGTLLRDGARVLHIGGAVRVAQVWDLPLPEPDRRSLVRRLGIVENGRLLATVHLTCRLRPDLALQFEALRAQGVKRIAVFTEDPSAQPAQALTGLGADVVISRDRRAQERWLDTAVERGERVALVHTGLRDLLPPGGLSLCPVDAEAGAHGVLLGEPLAALLAARATALELRSQLRRRFGRSVTLNAALMVAAALRWLPPIATTTIRHGLVFLLLQESMGLAQVRAGKPPQRQPRARPAARNHATA